MSNYDPYHIDLEDFVQILHPSEAIKKMAQSKMPVTKFRCKVFNITEDEEATEYEDLLTNIANSQDIQLVKQETHFNKMGDYIVALHWKESVKKDDKSTGSNPNSD
tara:strand:- start:721 stop:1038 length:318 start_codon:yes stop_codon:yes gene_type:complete